MTSSRAMLEIGEVSACTRMASWLEMAGMVVEECGVK